MHWVTERESRVRQVWGEYSYSDRLPSCCYLTLRWHCPWQGVPEASTHHPNTQPSTTAIPAAPLLKKPRLCPCMAPVFGSFFSPGCSAGYIGSLSLALAIQGCIGRELNFSSTAKALTTAEYASCCHLYIQQYVISFLSSSHLSLPSRPASSFFSSRLLALSVLSFCLCHLLLSSVSLGCLH